MHNFGCQNKIHGNYVRIYSFSCQRLHPFITLVAKIKYMKIMLEYIALLGKGYTNLLLD